MKYKIAVIEGDGVGPEIMNSALEILNTLTLPFEYIKLDVGYKKWMETGEAISQGDMDILKKCDATLKAPLYTPSSKEKNFSSVTLTIRKELDVYANIRPIKTFPGISPFTGLDLIIVRENTEGLYSGVEHSVNNGAVTERIITKASCEKICKYAFNLALKEGRRKVTCVHKANILKKTCGLFRETFFETAKDYPSIEAEETLVDACAYKLIRNPSSFDVIVTTNMFGDILSDEAAALTGSLGLVGSCNIGEKHAVFEPIHGTAPDIANEGVANPIGMIMAASYMCNFLGFKNEGEKIRKSVTEVLKEKKNLTPDLGGKLNTKQLTNKIKEVLIQKYVIQ